VVGVGRVGRRGDELVAVHAAAVLRRTVAPAGGATRPRRLRRQREDRLQAQRVSPVVTEVVGVEQPVAGLDEDLVEADGVRRHAGVGLVLGAERAQVALAVRCMTGRTGSELVQVAVGPAEGDLEDLVDLVEVQVAGELHTPPQRRCGPVEIDPDPIGDDVGAARPTPRPPGGGGSHVPGRRVKEPVEQRPLLLRAQPGGELAHRGDQLRTRIVGLTCAHDPTIPDAPVRSGSVGERDARRSSASTSAIATDGSGFQVSSWGGRSSGAHSRQVRGPAIRQPGWHRAARADAAASGRAHPAGQAPRSTPSTSLSPLTR
jgi:hypothetical protein